MSPVTITDLSLKNSVLSPQLKAMRKAYFRAVPEVCPERAALVTSHSLAAGLLKKDRISPLEKARLYRKVLEEKKAVVWHSKAWERVSGRMEDFPVDDRSPFAGSTTSKFKGVPIYPEFFGLTLWPELRTLRDRAKNPYQITDDEVRTLNRDVFPRWMESGIAELARKRSTPKELDQYQLVLKLVFFMTSKPNCISHTVPCFRRAVYEGLDAVIEEATERKSKADGDEERDFYQAIVEALSGIVSYARGLSEEARSMAAGETDAAVKEALNEIAEIYSHVPAKPARTFREGLTTVWLCWIAVHLENANVGLSLGRLDQLLHELYRDDVEAKRLTAEEAVELLCYLWLKIGDHVPSVPEGAEQLFGGTGSNQAITIGGVDANGDDAVNDLTYVMLRATELMKLRDPNLNARYYQGVNPPEYLRRLCEANVNTGATPALHNDKAVIEVLTSTDHSLEQARDYAVVGCVEPGSNGRAYGHSGALLVNLASALELALFNGYHRHTGLEKRVAPASGDARFFATFTRFRRALAEQIGWLLDQATDLNNLFGRVHQDSHPTPILSALFEGPMGNGKDLIFGGAEINSSGVGIIGLADVADSLTAIEKLAYEEESVSFADILDAIRNDFDGYDALRKRITEKMPKFGNDDSAADANAAWLVDTIHGFLHDRPNYRGGKYKAGYWTMTNHAGFGRLTGALPNGRKAGENFASGITPVSGATSALTKALNSVAGLPARRLPNGVALNLKYTREADMAEMLDGFVASVEGYFEGPEPRSNGGMEIQFNVVSYEDLVSAVEHPEEHPELLVRVSGYTAYFKDLNPQMQKEIIDRTEYVLSTGDAVRRPWFKLPKGAVTA
ncbi:MAG: pyruvate formate lyase family protein [Planctomycetota bacterium]|jgi:formate C-acetyltransferase